MKLVHLAVCGASALCLAASALAQTQSPPPSGTSQPSASPSSPTSPSGSPSGSASGGTSASGGASAARGKVPVTQNQTRKQKFDQLDSNHNGTISREEAAAAPALVIIFADTDTNGDGNISATEFEVVPLVQPDGSPVQ
jgi:hypothetical protein